MMLALIVTMGQDPPTTADDHRSRPASTVADWSAAADLVRRIQDGDAEAEAELVARYARGIALIVAHHCHDRGVVDDINQETFRIAIERLRRGEVREPARLSGFMVSLARNLVTEHFRRLTRREQAAADYEPQALHATTRSPLETLQQREHADLVRQVLAELPTPRDRLVLFRYYIAEEEREDICADLGMTRVHFHRVLFRARERFRELYERMTARSGSS
jgi:RNA polymerase sigma-70 factor (ECF subfamily)